MAVSAEANGWVKNEEAGTQGLYVNGIEVLRVTNEGIEVLGTIKSKVATPEDEAAMADLKAKADADAQSKAAGEARTGSMATESEVATVLNDTTERVPNEDEVTKDEEPNDPRPGLAGAPRGEVAEASPPIAANGGPDAEGETADRKAERDTSNQQRPNRARSRENERRTR